MKQLRIWLAIALQLLLVACGGGSDDGPVKGSSQGGGDSSITTSYFLNVSAASPSALMQASSVAEDAKVARPFSAQAASNLTRENFDAVVLVDDFNALDGYREVPVGIAAFESFGNGVYKVDIDGLPQVNGIIYVTVGANRLVFLMLRAGTQAEPVDVNLITSAADKALLEELKRLPAFPAVAVDDAIDARNETASCLGDLDTTGVENLEQFYAEQIEEQCPIPDLGSTQSCPTESGLCSVSGQVRGLQGLLQLSLNGGEAISITENGRFEFPVELSSNDRYVVTISSQPAEQECSLLNGSGFVGSSAINNIVVNCGETYSIGGTVSGLSGTLELMLGDDIDTLRVAGNGEFVFDAELSLQEEYGVTITEQPAGQTCTIENGSGSVTSDVTNITITCNDIQIPLYSVGGTVSGLDGGDLELSLNDEENLTVVENGAFTFNTTLGQSSLYEVTVVSSPAGYLCEVVNGSGAINAQSVTTVAVTCTVGSNRVRGTVSGLGAGVQLTLNEGISGTETITVQQDGNFEFQGLFFPNNQYAVMVTGTLGAERCLVSNGAGDFANGDANVTVNCAVFPGSISAGGDHVCATQDGETRCWGSNYFGQLGGGETLDSSFPVIASAGSAATELSSGDQHNCALLPSGGVRCWGDNNYSQSGDPETNIQLPGSAQGVVVGDRHSCAIMANGEVYCWGYVDVNNENANLFLPNFVPSINAVALAAGSTHVCAVIANGGGVRCWGDNGNSQLGDGTTSSTETPVTVLTGRTLALAARDNRNCAVSAAGTVSCWGGTFGTTPQAVAGITRAIDVGVGVDHVCVTTVEGGVQCWGNNDYGQLGNGGTESSAAPVAVTNVTNAVAVAAGNYHTCAMLATAQVVCWGSNFNSQLSAGADTYARFPVAVTQISGASQVSSGTDHNCALTSAGVYCWGSNEFGQLGNNSIVDSFDPVEALPYFAGATQISVGSTHSCALVSPNQVQCWGDNRRGQAGAGDNLNALLPNLVSGLSTASAISSGGDFNCALLITGSVVCWGDNTYGQLGTLTSLLSALPLPIPQLIGATQVSVGRSHACALLATGQVQCWGANDRGQLGDGSLNNSASPVTVTGITDAVAIDAGGDNTCAQLQSGALYCWGYNSDGQMGNGTFGSTQPVPQQVNIGFTPDIFSVNDAEICAATSAGPISCWGLVGIYWMAGAAYYNTLSTPAVLINSSAVSISAGAASDFICSTTANGDLSCSGRNDKGQIGFDPQTVYSTLPLEVQFDFGE